MKKITFSAFLCALLFAQSCTVGTDKQDPPKVSIEVKSSFGNAPFSLLTAYDYKANKKLKFNLMQFFVSKVELLQGTTTVPIADYAILDVGQSSAKMGNETAINPGNYTKIRFGIGVDAATNGRNPNEFPSSSPLAASGWYWSSWNSFTFLKAEGFYDNNLGFTYHTGRDTMYRTVEIPIQYEAKVGENKTLTLKLDLKKMFINGVDTFNIPALPQSQGEPNIPSKTAASIKIANNFQQAWSW
ncbi:MAG: hypothetical protein RI894_2442 [Bacteroidota bacterium]|jgi:hypothetical protein